jgi:Protein of unknown function (DUF3035)
MRKVILASVLLVMLSGLSACGKSTGVFGRARPDEFAVSRAAPLVVPPDFALTPPTPGAPRPQEADSSTQALQAMFGGPAVRSGVETSTVGRAGGNKGSVTRDIIAAPEGAGAQATASTPK